MKILDYYCHQGHQYEFFKTGHEFYLTGLDSLRPNWNAAHRPLPSNVNLIDERSAHNIKYDVVIIRSPLNPKRYDRFISRGAKPVAVGQTTSPYAISDKVRYMIWNSEHVMNECASFYNKRVTHIPIIHGIDPDEFRRLDIEKKDRALSVVNVFKARKEYVGYDFWKDTNGILGGLCDIVGHGNEDLRSSIGEAETFEKLIELYNSYKVYFNPTNHSANPRSRAEAMMTGAALVTTNNYDISKYIFHGKNGFLAENPKDAAKYIKLLMENKDLMDELSYEARETAIKFFNISDYTEKWNDVLWKL
jgi:glycosyltransferase involved in cell wall biosynthesis